MKRLSSALVCAWLVFGCGPYFPQAVFTPRAVPRYPEKEFVSGKLGILYPTFWRRYLVAAWRHLEGRPLTASEQAAYLPAKYEPPPKSEWQDVRTEREVPGQQFQWFINCGPDAFRRADAKYAELKRTFGETHAAVASWKKAQDTAFSNCEKGEAIPEPADSSLPPALLKERDYQIAAAHFYAMHYDEARARFLKMGDRYLAARCLIRKGQYAEAEKELIALGSPPLLGFVQAKLRPEESRTRLGELLSKGGRDAEFARELFDYEFLADRVTGNDEMSRWISAVQGNGEGALVEWRKTGKVSWLLAALMHAKTLDADVLAAAKAVPASSPAYASVRHQVGRVLLDSDHNEAARSWLDEALAVKSLPTSAINEFKKQRMTLARNFSEWERDLMRQPVAEHAEGEIFAEASTRGPLLDDDGAAALNNGLPLSLLRKLTIASEVVKTRAVLVSGGAYDEIYYILNHPVSSPVIAAGIDRRDAPPTGIDNYRANWWCKVEGKDAYPKWLNPSERAAAEKELAALRSLPTAPNWLALRAVKLVQEFPGDPRNAELLHLAVRATRYGCTDESTTAHSRAAFQLLHRRYPKSPWAARTKHYY